MSKVLNSARKQNPYFLEEAGEYLQANGFLRSESDHIPGTIYFVSGQEAVYIYGDNADFMYYDEGEPDQERPSFKRHMALTGIGTLDIFSWMLMFHISGTVPLRQFIKAAIKDGANISTDEALAPLLKHFKVTDDHEAAPICY